MFKFGAIKFNCLNSVYLPTSSSKGVMAVQAKASRYRMIVGSNPVPNLPVLERKIRENSNM